MHTETGEKIFSGRNPQTKSRCKKDISERSFPFVSKNWMSRKKHDHYYRKAKTEGYRSRAAYKLIQIHRKFGIFREGDTVVELGAAPGGWSQIALRFIGEKGILIGIDLQRIEPIKGAVFIKGDFTEKESADKIKEALGWREVSVVISDMSPNISGVYSTDHARSTYLAELALNFAVENLKRGGVLVVKIFEGEMIRDYLRSAKKHFGMVKLYSPKASRSSSSEIYMIAKGFRGRDGSDMSSENP